jgi:hypothetical protein
MNSIQQSPRLVLKMKNWEFWMTDAKKVDMQFWSMGYAMHICSLVCNYSWKISESKDSIRSLENRELVERGGIQKA